MSGWLASIPSPDPKWQQIEIDILGLHGRIQTYAIVILLGIAVATMWASRRLTKRGAEPGVILDVLLWAVLLGIIGARLYHVLTHPGDYFRAGDPWWRPLAIWEGGNAIFGSLIGGAAGVWLACRFSGLRFWSVADAIAPALLLAQVIGRLGNWFNQELFGLPTNLPWGLEIAADNSAIPKGLPQGTLFHPLFLYEMVWNAVGVIVLIWLERRLRLQWGKALAAYLIWYGLGRSYLESIRIDPSGFSVLGIPANQWAAFAAVLLGIVLFIVQSRRHPGLEPSPYRPGREWTAGEGDADADDADSGDADQGELSAGDQEPAGSSIR